MTLWRGIWLALGLIALALAGLATLPQAVVWPPEAMHLPFAAALSGAMKWLTESAAIGPVSVKDMTRGFARLIELPYEAVKILLVDGITEGKGRRATTIIPPSCSISTTGCCCRGSGASRGREVRHRSPRTWMRAVVFEPQLPRLVIASARRRLTAAHRRALLSMHQEQG